MSSYKQVSFPVDQIGTEFDSFKKTYMGIFGQKTSAEVFWTIGGILVTAGFKSFQVTFSIKK